MRQRVLLIAYQFPPVGGAGVQRVTKFTKYLPQFGWDVTVLTARNHSVPVLDHHLVADVPANTRIEHATTLEPGYHVKRATANASRGGPWYRQLPRAAVRRMATFCLQPDPQLLWVPDAIRRGRQILRGDKHDAVLVSGPPFSSFFVGATLARGANCPLILDYRDEWGLSNRYWEHRSNSRLSRLLQRQQQRWILRQASAVTATTARSAASLAAELDSLGSSAHTECIYNGYDQDDFPRIAGERASVAEVQRRPRFRLSHVGTLWNLTTCRPLVEAVELLSRTQPCLAEKLELEFIGRSTEREAELLRRLDRLPCQTRRIEYQPHLDAVSAMHQADQLCLLLADVPGAERVVPGKTFEYLATERPILAVAPSGETREILSRHPGVSAIHPQEVRRLADSLANSIRSHELQPARRIERQLQEFERKYQAARMARLLSDRGCASRSEIDFPATPIRTELPLSLSGR